MAVGGLAKLKKKRAGSGSRGKPSGARGWVIIVIAVVALLVAAAALFALGTHSGPVPSPSPSPAAPQRRREEPAVDVPVSVVTLAQTVADTEDVLATSEAVELAVDLAISEDPSKAVRERVRSMAVSTARTVVVCAAIESLAKMSMKTITQLVAKHGSVSSAAKASGAAAGALVIADTLYRCLADESYDEKRTESTCTDQGYLIAGTLLSPTALRELAIRGTKLARAASPLALRAAKTATRFAAKATSVAARLSAKLSTKVTARVGVAMARFSTRMTALATRIAARAATQAAATAVRMEVEASLGPVGVALIVLELVFMVVSVVLDSLCVGNFGEDCHVTAEELEQLNSDQTQMMIAAMETSELVDLILEVNTDGWTGYAEARAYMRGAYVSQNRANISRIFGTETVADWFAGLRTSDMKPGEALDLIAQFKKFVDEQNNTAIYAAAVSVPCANRGGKMVNGVCAAPKSMCLAYMEAVERLVGPRGAAFSSAAKFATVQLSILFTSSIRLAVDLHRDPSGAAKYTDPLIDAVAKCIRKVSGRVATFADAVDAMRAVDADIANEVAQILEPEDWTVVDDTFAARAKWAHESAHVRRESFRWVERVESSLVYRSPSEARASAGTSGVCVRDSAAAMNLHVCPYIVAATKKSGELQYVVDKDVPGHAVNWKTGACTRTARYCDKYDMHSVAFVTDTMGETLAATKPNYASACSESDDRRAVCTCGKSGVQKVLASVVGDTIQGYVNRTGLGITGMGVL
jgi:flagellar basal body-associated protein FliL